MPEQAFNLWKQQGHLYLWRYVPTQRNLRGWHMSVDQEGSDSIARLIDMMLASEWPTHRRLVVTVPQRIMIGGASARWRSASGLVLRYLKDDVGDDHWLLEVQDDLVTLSLGTSKMKQLQTAIVGVPRFKDDYAIGPDRGIL